MNPPVNKEPVPHSMMLEFTQMKGEQALMNQRLDSSIQAMTSSLQALQGDTRFLREKVDELAHGQSDFAHHSSGLERLAKSIEKMNLDSERRWEAHESDNKVVADRVAEHRTGVRLAWTAVTIIALVMGWLAKSEISRIDERFNAHISNGNEAKAMIEKRLDRIEIRLETNSQSIQTMKDSP